ncbi:MAG: OmpA family protein [Alphaproteobacteria bacterium]|nr:OmpA family protein [Alphaproteobacteria bacterium]
MEVAQVSKAPFQLKAKRARTLVVFSLVALLTGCSSASDLDVFGIFDDGPEAPATAGQSAVRAGGDEASAAASGQPTPSLSSVPPRPDDATPPDVRQRVVEGLVADRENARYSDQSIRLQGSTRETVPAPATTVAPPPPTISSDAATQTSSATPSSATPSQTTSLVREPIPRVAPPPVTPLPTGPTPSVRVDPTALDGGSSFPLRATQVTVDEQVATIHFAHSSSRLDDRDKQVLAQVASAQRQNNADVVVIGHASGRTQQLDKIEHELANFRISLARANRVASELIAMGVDPQKVQVEAFADDSQLFSETMPTGEAGNRRAEVYFRQ